MGFHGREMKHINAGGIEINFQRTVRVPEGKINDLPAGLGSFPIYKVSDFRSGTPSEWRDDGFFMPLYAQEAMWISFSHGNEPRAMIVGAGNINAVTGKPFDPSKSQLENSRSKESTLDVKLEGKQNYLVVPPQPWLDGWKAKDGKIYQFVGAELGSGETVEGQVTGEEKVGGIQFIVYAPKEGKKLYKAERPHEIMLGGSGDYDTLVPKGPFAMGVSYAGVSMGVGSESSHFAYRGAGEPVAAGASSVRSMGLGRGGEIKQKIYPDPYGIEVWTRDPVAVEIIYLVSSEDFKQITGHDAPPSPITKETYKTMGIPWFKLQDGHYADTKGSGVFGKLKPVSHGKKDLLDKLKPMC